MSKIGGEENAYAVAVEKKLDMDPSKASMTDTFEHFFLIIRFVYLLESPRRGDLKKYSKRLIS